MSNKNHEELPLAACYWLDNMLVSIHQLLCQYTGTHQLKLSHFENIEY